MPAMRGNTHFISPDALCCADNVEGTNDKWRQRKRFAIKPMLAFFLTRRQRIPVVCQREKNIHAVTKFYCGFALSLVMETTKTEYFLISFLIYCITNLMYLFVLIGITLEVAEKLFFWGSIIKINGKELWNRKPLTKINITHRKLESNTSATPWIILIPRS